jgi:site-specific recombinase XerD
MTKRPRPTLQQLFDRQIRDLATILRPATIKTYRCDAKNFLCYLQANHPEVSRPSQLRRDPHILGWLRSLYEHRPPLTNATRQGTIINVRRLLQDLAGSDDPPRENLFVRGDYPPNEKHLPRPLSPEDDWRLQQQLSKRGNLRSKGLLLLRATGMRIGECLKLTVDSMRELGQNQWAIRVPLGKLHTERWVPVDEDTCRIFRDILSLRSSGELTQGVETSALLLQHKERAVSYELMRRELKAAAREAGCSVRPTLHQLRHSYGTEMLRAGASLPVVKELLGHRSVEMTMRYVQVSQIDLQREYHRARQKMGEFHVIPKLTRPAVIPHWEAAWKGGRRSQGSFESPQGDEWPRESSCGRHIVGILKRQSKNPAHKFSPRIIAGPAAAFLCIFVIGRKELLSCRTVGVRQRIGAF